MSPAVCLLAFLVAVGQDERPAETPEKWTDLGRRHLSEGRLDSALEAYEKAAALNPLSSWPHYELAKVHWKSGKARKALDEMAVAIDLTRFDGSGLLTFRLYRAEILVWLGRLDEAESEIKFVLDRDGTNVKAHYEMARLYLKQGRDDEAMDEALAVIKSGTRMDDGSYLVGKILLNKEMYPEASSALRRTLSMNPAHAEARYALAQALKRMGKTEEAAKEMETHQSFQRKRDEVDKLQRSNHEPLCLHCSGILSRLYMELGQFKNARLHAERVLKEKPDDSKSLCRLGYILSEMGDHEGAIRRYRRAMEVQADYAVAYNNLAWLLATVKEFQDPDEAIRLAEKAKDLGSDRPGTLAEARFCNGEVEEACRTLETAIRKGHPEAARYREQLKRFREKRPSGEVPESVTRSTSAPVGEKGESR
ncbi:MAG: tetratricopeptide repeat protein [Planctomycetota bacterium]|nr:tetratricopeptide repeat protein [Planctomycetota bacterium]